MIRDTESTPNAQVKTECYTEYYWKETSLYLCQALIATINPTTPIIHHFPDPSRFRFARSCFFSASSICPRLPRASSSARLRAASSSSVFRTHSKFAACSVGNSVGNLLFCVLFHFRDLVAYRTRSADVAAILPAVF